MGCWNDEITVFADTNLGTRIVVVVSPHSTANHFKREVEMAHLNCFPQLGQIKVKVVMVKRNSCFYHLPDTLPLKHVFQRLKGIRSLHVEARQYNSIIFSSELVDDQVWDQYGDGRTKLKASRAETNVEKLKCRRKRKRSACLKTTLSDVLRIVHFSKKKKKKKKKVKKSYKHKCLKGPDEPLVSTGSFVLPTYDCEGGKVEEEHKSSPATESHCEDLSEAVSVSGIIRKYFSSHDEVNSSSRFSLEGAQTPQGEQTTARTYHCDLKVEHALVSPCLAKTPLQISEVPVPNKISSRASRNKSKRIEIGHRLISASKSLGLMASKNKFSTPGKLVSKSASCIRSLVFEMSDEDK